ncbi:hypothetical protein SUGI_0221450 [Cryptomeria japonica]|uniref:NADH dehydrogenase [ubiquinone] flavoprotein 2, mitochondrial-like n=1 Tax=Cryptomeria japonica TaxID=3369 RepID=UPI0024089964|nr:NADH dehydrogenase [ubiquinone] flavoprotein 2, mitochondrial-like [Cryptomeria japonica]GLJ13859.1 hypothetical protein SUGI_0221450 [Cryptomeria japonica]
MKIVEILGMDPMKMVGILAMALICVYEVATFYLMFNREKFGQYHLLVCGANSCMNWGSCDSEVAFFKHLGVKRNEVTKYGMFSVCKMKCMGCCVNSPMIVIVDYTKGSEGFSYNYYEEVTPKHVCEIAKMVKHGETGLVGTQNLNHIKSDLAGGNTILLVEPNPPSSHDLDA